MDVLHVIESQAPAAEEHRPAESDRGDARAGPPHRRDPELVATVQAARAGDADAWTRLVQRFDPGLRHVARSYRLSPADVDEVVQATWLYLLETIERIREPAAIVAWLVTVTRRNALRRRQTHTRELLSDDPRLGDRPDCDAPEADVLADERRAVLTGAIAALPDRHRRLVTALLTQPTLDYRQLGELLSMPVGSIGPSRARAFARLARDAQLRAVSDLPTVRQARPASICAAASSPV
jgi:RNA polymerase sigma factor (sigma-70 family)